MELKLYTVYDSKAESYTVPHAMRAKGEAIRDFEQSVNNPDTRFYKSPADFTLFEIGKFDPQTGVCDIYETKNNLGTGNEFFKKQ